GRRIDKHAFQHLVSQSQCPAFAFHYEKHPEDFRMADKSNDRVTLLAGGDIGPIYEPTDEIAELISPVLRQADLRFGQCERTYSERGWPEFISSHGGNSSRMHPRMAKVWETANIDIISLASNHTMDWGPDALLDTRDLFRRMGKHPIGAGRDRDD